MVVPKRKTIDELRRSINTVIISPSVEFNLLFVIFEGKFEMDE